MRVVDELARLKEQVYKLERKYCEKCQECDCDCCHKAIRRAEEPRMKGKWIYHDDDDMRFDTYHCSVCRKLFTVDAERFDDIGLVKEDLRFCPNCGASMSEGEK